ncbi:MAG: hypothetical protein EOP48_03085 [Sphingobacteriales bacterium]|nr:MAG: hypothetical protein EOP48_03085 [Sphingobacteriales bacterium]
MNIQLAFEKTLSRLIQHRGEFPYIEDLVNDIETSTVSFRSLDDKASPGSLKNNILAIYKIERQLASSQQGSFAELAYDLLLKNLSITSQTHIAISEIITDRGTYKVFTDFDRKVLLGVLISQVTLQQEQEKIQKAKEMASIINVPIGIDDSRVKHLFHNGSYQGE